MDFWWGVGIVVVGLVVSIALHEVGHLLPAKRFGVKVPQYFVGFGPTLWSTKRGETEYGLKAVPLGGFIRMIGMFPPGKPVSEDAGAEERLRRRGLKGIVESIAADARQMSAEEVAPGEEHRTFYALSTPKKLAVMFGGPVVNLIIAIVLFTVILTGLGTPAASNRLAGISECVLPVGVSRECTAADPQAPATLAGLAAGDRIVSWDGTEIATWEDISAAIAAGGTSAVDVVVERDGAEVTLSVTPTLAERPVFDDEGAPVVDGTGAAVTAEAPYVGIGPAYELERQPLSTVGSVVGRVFTGTVEVVITLPQRLVGIAQSVFGERERDPNVVGLIGIGRFAGEITAQDGYAPNERVVNLLSLVASLNMALFVFNMVPLLPLDGGHIAGALFEGARRRVAAWRGQPDPGHVDTAKLMPLTYVVVTFMIAMSLLLAVADIIRPVTFG